MKKNLHKKQTGIKFKCCRCGECCKTIGRVYLYFTDIQDISAKLVCSIQDFIQKFCEFRIERFNFKDRVFFFEILAISKGKNNECIFLNGEVCMIHAFKPLQCKLAPFIDPIITDESIWSAFYEKCIGFNRGDIWDTNKIISVLNAHREARFYYYKCLNENGLSLEKLLKTRIVKKPFFANINIPMPYDEFMCRKVNLVTAITQREVI